STSLTVRSGHRRGSQRQRKYTRGFNLRFQLVDNGANRARLGRWSDAVPGATVLSGRDLLGPPGKPPTRRSETNSMKSKMNAGIIRRRKRQSGTEFIEFALSSLLLFPLMMGVVIIGLNLGRSIQVAQVCRDAGSMYVRGI